jgi:hypothetical protein
MLLLAAGVTGCGHHYHLRGHNAGNLQNSPEIRLKAGESKLAVSEGLSIKSLMPACCMIQIEDKSVARTPIEGGKARIIGVREGKTKARYPLEDEPNHGFWIIVEPQVQ